MSGSRARAVQSPHLPGASVGALLYAIWVILLQGWPLESSRIAKQPPELREPYGISQRR